MRRSNSSNRAVEAATVAMVTVRVIGTWPVLTGMDAGWTEQVAPAGAPEQAEKVTVPSKVETTVNRKVALCPAVMVCCKPSRLGVMVKLTDCVSPERETD